MSRTIILATLLILGNTNLINNFDDLYKNRKWTYLYTRYAEYLDSEVYLDLKSLKRKGNEVRYWVFEVDNVELTNTKYEFMLVYVDCLKKRSELLAYIAFDKNKKNLHTKIETMDTNTILVPERTQFFDSLKTREPEFQYVCKSLKNN